MAAMITAGKSSIRGRANAKPTLSQAAYESIRSLILHGELDAGSLVTEGMFAERLEFGKAPIRTALQRLAVEGLVSIEPRRGIVVAFQSVQDVLDLFEVRILVEQRVVRSIAGRLTVQQIDRLHAKLAQVTAASATADPSVVVANDFSLHRLLCEIHGNKQLLGILDRILDGLYREVWIMQSRCVNLGQSVCLKHEEIVDAVICGDAAHAERAMTEHLQTGEQCVLSRRPHFDRV